MRRSSIPPTRRIFYIFPSRLNALKRQRLVVEALAHTRAKVRVCFSGPDIEAGYHEECMALARRSKVHSRIEWLGTVSEEAKRDLYARCLGVLFRPWMRIMATSHWRPCWPKARDHLRGFRRPAGIRRRSGNRPRFANLRREEMAAAMDELWEDRARARRWGEAGRQRYSDLRIDWGTVLEQLLQ